MQRFFLFIAVLFFIQALVAQQIRGVVFDSETGEELIGATLIWKGSSTGTISGIDGSFSIGKSDNSEVLVISFIGYETLEYRIRNVNSKLRIALQPNSHLIGEVVIVGNHARNNDSGARLLERNSITVLNVVSAQAIAVSPDLTVANVIQRMSGVTMERDNSGDGQFALLRGMDKRFNYTMVNGMKIPSPDNKNRFVPLDIFPAELLDRLEVTKALTADMEGDGIGGAINLVMRDAPSQFQVNANLSTGFNSQFFSRPYQQFNHSAINRQSLFTQYGLGFPAQTSDFTTQNLRVTERNFVPMNLMGGFSAGGRAFSDALGIIVAASHMDTYRGSTSNRYDRTRDANGEQSVTFRYFSTQQKRTGLHAKFDLRLNPNHKLMWYNAYMNFQNIQVRDSRARDRHEYRLRWNQQTILSSMLNGRHNFLNESLRFNWSFAYGNATNETPDQATARLRVGRDGRTYADPTGGVLERRWENNSDNDMAGFVNLIYHTQLGRVKTEWSTGGMFRDRFRDSHFHTYRFRVNNPMVRQYRGESWQQLDEIDIRYEGGNFNDPLNYDATERIGAGYVQLRATHNRLQVVSGLRVEHTRQGYDLKFPQNNIQNSGLQEYYDWLPSVHLRYQLNPNTNLRLSYVRAINRPSFFEIVPYRMEFEDFYETGNPELNRTVADNFDIRYEYFFRQSEQIMIGLFHKRIKDPIEYIFVDLGQQAFYMPYNLGTAFNTGIEIDVTKHFNWLGIKANYTFTNSRITTNKWLIAEDLNPNSPHTTKIVDVYQTRPLFGQASHVANLTLMYINDNNGWDAQLALSYTGRRLVYISEYVDEDWWQAGFLRLDASIEKSFANTGITLFAKANNLLNTPMFQYINPNARDADRFNDFARRGNGGLLERVERYGQTILIGIRYRL